MKKVGVLVGREWSFPPRFIEEVNGRNAGVVAEFAKLGGTKMDDTIPYTVLVDRISHEVPYYRSYLKHAVLEGVTAINNPFMWTADDKFFGASLCAKLGLAHPKTAALPNKDYVPGIVKTESLRNLVYPMDWQAIVDYVGLPCILKDAHGGGWRGVYVCHSIEELIRYYDGSGLLTMIAQEFIKWDQYVRCMCLGRDLVLPMPYDTHNRKYLPDDTYLDPAVRKRVIDDSLKDEVRVTVIATGFGPERYRRRRREERPAEEGAGTRTPTRDEGAFEVPEDVLEVPSFLRDA